MVHCATPTYTVSTGLQLLSGLILKKNYMIKRDFLQLCINNQNKVHFRLKCCSENGNKNMNNFSYSFRSSAISLSFRSISALAVL